MKDRNQNIKIFIFVILVVIICSILYLWAMYSTDKINCICGNTSILIERFRCGC